MWMVALGTLVQLVLGMKSLCFFKTHAYVRRNEIRVYLVSRIISSVRSRKRISENCKVRSLGKKPDYATQTFEGEPIFTSVNDLNCSVGEGISNNVKYRFHLSRSEWFGSYEVTLCD